MSNEQHAEWLSLLDISGPFLSPPVLDRVFPQGLEVADPDHAAKLRLAHEEWAEEQQKPEPDPAIHDAWIWLVLTETLGLTPEVLLEGDGIPSHVAFTTPEHGERVRPDFVVFDPEDEPGTRKLRLLISVWSPDTELDQPIDDSRWTASPIDRMAALCRAEEVGLRLGLVTNGERWALVDAPVGETSAHASWYASLWGQEPLTLRAFRSLLGLRRFFGVAEEDRLEAMLIESTNYQADVTDQLGFQVRRAVEVLVQAIDHADADSGRTLLHDTDPARIYEAALTVMMRLVFLFSAEERGLLKLGDPMYDQFYAVSTLRAQLREAADRVGEEVLERRQDAWSRLLGTFRAIYAGVHHEALQIIPYGSSLFDPDRFPFLEGRTDETTWHGAESIPLPIDNRTVLLLLESLQLLDLGPGKGARKLSFRALDIEQIGHVYETLLDHSAYRATEAMVSLQGNQGREPEIPISQMHELVLHDDDEALIQFLKAELKKGVSPIRKALEKTPEPEVVAKLRSASGGDEVLLAKLLPFHDLIRLDPWGDPVVIREGAVFVTAGEDRRSTGTHYTPRALTEEIVQYALEPVVYRGPAEGKDRDEWELKAPDEILELKVCDPAMGSGAFLVQACRYLSTRLVEAWDQTGETGLNTDGNELIPADPEERLALARRLIADRCLYGVDVNPLAVEMAKLSMWLVTLSRSRPFSFLDHALRCGDSLLGVHDLDQIRLFGLLPSQTSRRPKGLFDATELIAEAIDRATSARRDLESFTVRDMYDVSRKSELLEAADFRVNHMRLLGDLVVGVALAEQRGDTGTRDAVISAVNSWLATNAPEERENLDSVRSRLLGNGTEGQATRRPFHWPIEFPEVFTTEAAGFSAFVMNPPFLGSQKTRQALGDDYREYLFRTIGNGVRGIADLCAFFLLRASQLISSRGGFGSLATNTVAQGDTKEVGLDQLARTGTIVRAVRTRAWPGLANTEVSQLWMFFGDWEAESILDGRPVRAIGPELRPEGRISGSPIPLRSNEDSSFIGYYLLGLGFVLNKAKALEIVNSDPSYSDVVRPYLNGRDLNSRPDQSASRWAINFWDWPLERAEDYPLALEIVRNEVKPQRDKVRRKSNRERWWRYAEDRPGMRRAIGGLSRVLVRAQVSSTWEFAFVPSDWILDSKLIVFATESHSEMANLMSSFHWEWALKYGTTMRLDLSYTPSAIHSTYPFPEESGTCGQLAKTYEETRSSICADRGVGLTTIFNRFHDPSEDSTDIKSLRQTREALDVAVAGAYGWADLDMSYSFEETRQGYRLRPSFEVRQEILDRLLELNHERHAAEEPRSPESARLSKPGGEAVSRTARQAESLFDEG